MLLLLLIALGCLFIWWTSVPRRIREYGNKMPGPRSYPVVGSIFNFRLAGTRAIKDWEDALQKYGNTFRFWIGSYLYVYINEPEDMQMILSSPSLITKSVSYKGLSSWLGNGLLITSGDLWHMRRKAITPTFHFKILENFVPIFSKCANTLVDCLQDKVGGGPFSLTEYMSNCALDTIAETAMGTELHAQTNPDDLYPSSIFRMTKLVGDSICNPFLFMEPFYTILGRRKLHSDLLKNLFSLPLEVIKMKRYEKQNNTSNSTSSEVFGTKKKVAFLELLLEMKENRVSAFQTDQDIKDEVVTFMFEGHDTTTMALTYTLWLLGLHPGIQEELFQEVSEILSKNEPSIEEYQKMKLLERVIKESLRLYPPVPSFSRTVTEDIVLPASGHVVPAGAHVGLYVYTMQRRADLFPEPHKFDPDRFLQQQEHPFSFLPFSAGPRNCIGQKFAMLELKIVISNVVSNYRIHSERQLALKRDLLLRSQEGPYVSLSRRK